MIISHQRKFIFVHNYKVAGTSIKNSLKAYNNHGLRDRGRLETLKFIMAGHPWIFSSQFGVHITAAALKAQLPAKIFNSYFKFGFVRNPWDWQVSLYTFMLKDEQHFQHKLIKSMKDFDEYIDWRVHNDLHFQKDFFYEGDACLVDFIGKFERLDNDFEKVCRSIRVDATLPHLNKSRDDNAYLKYYSSASAAMVSQAFKTDIELFGYAEPEI